MQESGSSSFQFFKLHKVEPILFAVENGGGLHRGDSLLVHLQGHGIGAAVSLAMAGVVPFHSGSVLRWLDPVSCLGHLAIPPGTQGLDQESL